MITYKQYNFCRKIGLPPIPHVERHFNSVNFGLLDIFKRKPKNQPEENTEEDLSKLREESTKKGYAKSKDGKFVYIEGAPFVLDDDHTNYYYIVNGIYIFFNANCNLKKIAKVYSQQNQMRFLNSFKGMGGQAWAAALARRIPCSFDDAMSILHSHMKREYLQITENALLLVVSGPEIQKIIKQPSNSKKTICLQFCMQFPQHRIYVAFVIK